jgi:predicted  nucleic acid-binding Zn-ribbon protein
LLALQDRDTAIDRLQHRLAHLEQRVALDELAKAATARSARRAEVQGRLATAAAAQKALEDDLATTETRIAEIDKRMYSGTVSASRDLQAMADEVAHLKERVSTLEEQVLEAMDVREPVDAELGAIDAEAAAADQDAERLRGEVAEAEAAINAELATERAAREEAAAAVPEALRKEYEKLRAKLDGVGAARLSGNQCTGCHLTLPATEVDRIRHAPEDEVAYCDNCGRILVR